MRLINWTINALQELGRCPQCEGYADAVEALQRRLAQQHERADGVAAERDLAVASSEHISALLDAELATSARFEKKWRAALTELEKSQAEIARMRELAVEALKRRSSGAATEMVDACIKAIVKGGDS